MVVRPWFGSLLDSNKIHDMKKKLCTGINCLQIFESALPRKISMGQSKNGQILLVVSGQLGFVIVPFSNAPIKMNPIYVQYINLVRDHELGSIFTNIRVTVPDLFELIRRIQMSAKHRGVRFNQSLLINVYNYASNEEHSSTNINGDFLYFQLLINGLLRFPYDQTNKDKFLHFCKQEYQGNQQQLNIIKEFGDTYLPECALHSYSKYTFLHEILNRALRIGNINILLLFGFFIQDLYKRLEYLQRKQGLIKMRVYRGQCISKQELYRLKRSMEKFVYIYSFWSTSLDPEVSLMYLNPSIGEDYGVLFEIDVDPNFSYGPTPFANISTESQFECEQEVLFMIGSIFRVVDIREENNVTVIRMESHSKIPDYDMTLLLEHTQIENDKYHKYFSFGHVPRTTDMYDQAELFYTRILNGLENDHPLAVHIWNAIGLVKKAKGEVEISSKWLRKSLQKYEKMGNLTGIAACLQNLANTHQMKGEYDYAIEKYKKALDILHKLPGNQDKSVADCFLNLGAAYSEEGKFNEAVSYYFTALDIRKRFLPHTHVDIAMIINNIGDVFFHSGKYNCALQYFGQALSIFKISLPFEHPFIATIYYNIGVCYLHVGEYRSALSFIDTAASIRRKTLPMKHPDVLKCTYTIDYIHGTLNL